MSPPPLRCTTARGPVLGAAAVPLLLSAMQCEKVQRTRTGLSYNRNSLVPEFGLPSNPSSAEHHSVAVIYKLSRALHHTAPDTTACLIHSIRMADVFTRKRRSEIMAAVHSRGNKETEIRLISMLRAAGITGWRRHRSLPGHPDFVFPQSRLAVFVDGCFWHGCRWHCRMPQGNREYWEHKIARNCARDRATNQVLRHAGWRVLRIWGHSLRSPDAVLRRITSELSASHKGCKNRSHRNERHRKNSS